MNLKTKIKSIVQDVVEWCPSREVNFNIGFYEEYIQEKTRAQALGEMVASQDYALESLRSVIREKDSQISKINSDLVKCQDALETHNSVVAEKRERINELEQNVLDLEKRLAESLKRPAYRPRIPLEVKRAFYHRPKGTATVRSFLEEEFGYDDDDFYYKSPKPNERRKE